jgi:hypothetical protein
MREALSLLEAGINTGHSASDGEEGSPVRTRDLELEGDSLSHKPS